MKKPILWMWIVATLASACGSQVDAEYRGDLQRTVQGRLVLDEGTPMPGEMDVLIYWYTSQDNDTVPLYDVATVQPTFPAGFDIKLVSPPPLAAMTSGGIYVTTQTFAPDESNIAIGMVAAVPKGTDFRKFLDGDLVPEVVGILEDYVVVYTDSDVKPNTYSAALLDGTPKKGFHLMHAVDDDDVWKTHDKVDCSDVDDGSCDDELDAALEEGISEEEKNARGLAYYMCTYAQTREAGCFLDDLAKGKRDHVSPLKNGEEPDITIHISSDSSKLDPPDFFH